MKISQLLWLILASIIYIGCRGDAKTNDVSVDEVDDFMQNVFGEEKSNSFDCEALISSTEFSKTCIAKQKGYTLEKEIENALICIYLLKSDDSTVDVVINTSPMALLTGQVYKAAKSDAEKKGSVKKVRNLGQSAFYHESEYTASDYTILNRDLVFYQGKSMFTLHTSMGSKSKDNCMSNRQQLTKLAKLLLASLEKQS